MKPDKYRQRLRAGAADDRLRRQIATEAARRLLAPSGELAQEPTPTEYYNAKRRAAAVLGHRVRPGDLPSDSEVRQQIAALRRRPSAVLDHGPEPSGDEPALLADHLDRFAIYRMRLAPLETVKQDPRSHPEGDALYHSLQVFELARRARPYDEELLLAALLHHVGKAIDPRDPVAATLDALRGTLTERTAWLIAHLPDLSSRSPHPPGSKERAALEASEHFEDLLLLHELDEAGRVVGAQVGTIDEALDALRELQEEHDLRESDREP